jgi:hypothetical protein
MTLIALPPEEITADTAYGSDENHPSATSEGIELIALGKGVGAKDKAKKAQKPTDQSDVASATEAQKTH